MTDPIDTIVAAVRGKPVAMLNLARTLLIPQGKTEAARSLAAEALALDPANPEIRARARGIMAHGIGEWYFSMVQDEPRHRLYAEAMRTLFPPNCTVLDIGAGTGLFAMIAARKGARVIACERDPAVAEAARRIVAQNGLSDRVTILTKSSIDLQIGVDLEEPADVLLWDNLANNLLGVGAAETVEDAKRRLIKPDAPILPARAEIMVSLVEDLRPRERLMDTVDGFDMSAFNVHSPTNLTMQPTRLTARSDGACLFDVDFRAPGPIRPDRGSVTVTATGGPVHGIRQWLRFHLTDDLVYDTSDPTVTAFGSQFHDTPLQSFEPGQKVTIAGAHDGVLTWFWIDAE